MAQRPRIPEKLRRQVLMETGYLCAVPGCGAETTEIAHIVAYAECRKHEFANLIALCPNHHTRYDKGQIPQEAIEEWKRQLNAKAVTAAEQDERIIKLEQRNIELDEKLRQQSQQFSEQLAALEARLQELTPASRAARQVSADIDLVSQADRHYQAGLEAYLKGSYVEALAEFEAAHRLAPTATTAEACGALYDNLDRLADALAAYEEAEELLRQQGESPDISLLMNRGATYRRMYRFSEALAAFRAAEELRVAQGLPANADLLVHIGALLARLGNYQAALAAYKLAEVARRKQGLPEDPAIANNRGNICVQLGQYLEALAYYRKAERLNRAQGWPPNPLQAKNIGIVYRYQGFTLRALQQFARAERMELKRKQRPDPALVMHRGAALCDLGRFDEAMAQLELAEQLFRQKGVPVHQLCHIFRGEAWQKQGNREAALKCARQAQAAAAAIKVPEHPDLAKLLAALGAE